MQEQEGVLSQITTVPAFHTQCSQVNNKRKRDDGGWCEGLPFLIIIGLNGLQQREHSVLFLERHPSFDVTDV